MITGLGSTKQIRRNQVSNGTEENSTGCTQVRVDYALGVIATLLLTGCQGATGNISATDPTERGLSYIAAAIVTAAVIRAFFNK